MTTGLHAVLGQAARLGSEVFWVSLGNGLMLLGSFVGIKILTGLLQPDEYGRLALGLAAASALHMLIFVPLGQHTLRFFPVAAAAGRLGPFQRLTDWAYRRASHAVIAAGGLGLVALALVSRQDWLVFGGIVLPYAIVMGWRARYENQQMAARQRRTVALFQAGDAWLRPALAAVAIVLIFPSAWLALVGYALAAGGLAFWQARSAAPLFPTVRGSGAAGATSIDESDRLALWRYCVPAGLVAASGAFSLYADRWALESLLGTHELGLYFAIYQIANAPAVLFVGIVTQFFLPIIFGKAGTLDLPEQAARSARVLTLTIAAFLALMAPIVIIAWLFSEPIVRIITDQSYVAHHGLLWILMVALGLNQLGLILTYKGAYQNRLWLYVAPRLGQAALLIGSMVVLVPAIGVAGAAYAVLVAATGHVVCLIIVNRRLGRGTRREGSA